MMGALSLGAGSLLTSCKGSSAKKSVTPLLHVGDLKHPPGDPDDHFDVAVAYALARRGALDLRGMVLNYIPDDWDTEPAVVAIAQMNRLTGMSVPVSIGTSRHLKNRRDAIPDAPIRETAAVRFIIEQLRASSCPVAIVCVGSAVDIAVAALREPRLFKEKCAGVYLNSGSAHDNPEGGYPLYNGLECNVWLAPAAFAAMFDIPCPLYWYPRARRSVFRYDGLKASVIACNQAKRFANKRKKYK